MVAAGHDEDDEKERKGTPLVRVLGFARAMLDVVRNITAPNGERLRIRIGGASVDWISSYVGCAVHSAHGAGVFLPNPEHDGSGSHV